MAANVQSKASEAPMTMRTALAGLLLLTSSPLWAEGSGHQQNPYMMQQAMNGDKTAQMMMMMGGGMGGGGGGHRGGGGAVATAGRPVQIISRC